MSDGGGEAPRKNLLPGQSRLFMTMILVGLFFLMWLIFKPFLMLILMSIFIAILALPIDKFWEKVLPNRIAAWGTMLSILVIITLPVAGMGFLLFQDAERAVGAIADCNDNPDCELRDRMHGLVEKFQPGTPEEVNATADDLWNATQDQVSRILLDIVKQAPTFILDLTVAITIIMFVVYYVLTEGDRLINYLRRALPLPPKQTDYLMTEAHGGVKAVFFGQIVTAMAQGAIGGLSFIIAGVPGAIIWTMVMAILSLLPVVGAFLVWIPIGIYLLAEGQIWQGVFVLVWGFVVVSQVDNIIRPKLIGDKADIHPIFVLIGVLGGSAAFGFVGLFLGPLLVGVTVSVLKVWERDYRDPGLGTPPAPPEPVKRLKKKRGMLGKKKE